MQQNQDSLNKTRFALIWTSILSEPFLTLYGLMAFILRKDLDATALQIALLVMLKPAVSLLSLYWSHLIVDRRDKLLSNVILAGVLGRLPFLLFPFIYNTWYLIACAGIYMMMVRGGVPAWMEILKLNMPAKERSKSFSWGGAIAYAEGIILAIPLGFLLDAYPLLWRWIFPLFALLGILGVCLQARIPITLEKVPMSFRPKGGSLKQWLLDPWKQAWALVGKRKDFYRFQWGFMLCGLALMVVHPALPIFFADVLDLSYTDMMIAISLFRGLGYSLTAQYWAKLFSRMNIFSFTCLFFSLVGFFITFLISGSLSVYCVYIGFFIYGAALAGNHLSWNLSGPAFSENENSSLYSSVNVMTVGMRGIIGPPIGGLLCILLGPVAVLSIGAFLSFYAGMKMFEWGKELIIAPQEIS